MMGTGSIKIGISGVRGVVGKTLNPEIVINFTRAFSTLIRRGRVAVALDTRPSGPMLKNAVLSGLIFSGITPIDTHTLPTPTLQIYVKEKKLDGGIMVTASHNMEEWNGLKFISPEGLFLFPTIAQNLIDIYHQEAFIIPCQNRFPGIEEEKEAFAIHSSKIDRIIDRENIRRKKFRILVDPGGGVGALFDRPFLENLGCQVDMVNSESPGTFPRPPEPSPANLEETSKLMQKGTYDLGFAQDPDCDRLSLLDEKGTPLGGDLSLAFALWGYLSSGRRGNVVINLSTSRTVEEVVKRAGSTVSRSPVGEINVVGQMIREKSLAGGEGNGGVIIPEVHLCRDSFTGMALILDLLARSDKTVSQLTEQIPGYSMVASKVPLSASAAQRVIVLLKEEYPQGDGRDGLRVDTADYWFHIRISNTEPVLRIVAEGAEGETGPLVARLEQKIRDMGE